MVLLKVKQKENAQQLDLFATDEEDTGESSGSGLQILCNLEFKQTALDLYVDDKEAPTDFWITREHIGSILGYAHPANSIANIHSRNKKRLDSMSKVFKMQTASGTQELTVYNFKGLLEICRCSTKDKANEVMDFLWDIADTIRRHGVYMTPKKAEQLIADPDLIISLATRVKEEKVAREKAEKQVLALAESNSNLSKVKQELEAQAIKNAPKIEFADAVQDSGTNIRVAGLAKLLRNMGWDIGPYKLFSWLRRNGYVYYSGNDNVPMQVYINNGIFAVHETIDAGGHAHITTYVTPKGQEYFINRFLRLKEEYLAGGTELKIY